MGNVEILSLVEVENAEEDWLSLFNALELLDKEVLARMGKFDDKTYVSLSVIRELVNSAKHIAKGQWKGIHILTKIKETGVARNQ